MKRKTLLATAILAGTLLLSQVAVSAAEDYLGTWNTLVSNVVAHMELKEDKTYVTTFDLEGIEPQEGTWEEKDGTLIIDPGDEYETVLTISEDELVMDEDHKFIRGDVEPVVFAEVKADAKAEEFEGKWESTYLGFDNYVDKAVKDDEYLQVEIKDGKINVIQTFIDDSEFEVTAEYKDGKYEGESVPADEYDKGNLIEVKYLLPNFHRLYKPCGISGVKQC